MNPDTVSRLYYNLNHAIGYDDDGNHDEDHNATEHDDDDAKHHP